MIYLGTCHRCPLQHAGETAQKLHWHKTGFDQPDKSGFYRILSDHFHKGVCCNVSYSVQILEKLEGNL